MNFHDPFGAPEIFVEGVAYREIVGANLVRMGFFACENGDKIVRLKLLIPAHKLLAEQKLTREFVLRDPVLVN